MKLKNTSGRETYNYFKCVCACLGIVKGNSVLDIGNRGLPIGGDFESKIAIDLHPYEGCIVEDWTESTRKADVIVCLQVLEHVPKPKAFMSKILRSCKIAIVSIPFNWGPTKGHLWNYLLKVPSPREPLISSVVTDSNVERLISIFKGDL